MSERGIVCKLDGSTKTPGECYWDDCSNEQYFECFPSEEISPGVAKPMKVYDPQKNK